ALRLEEPLRLDRDVPGPLGEPEHGPLPALVAPRLRTRARGRFEVERDPRARDRLAVGPGHDAVRPAGAGPGLGRQEDGGQGEGENGRENGGVERAVGHGSELSTADAAAGCSLSARAGYRPVRRRTDRFAEASST